MTPTPSNPPESVCAPHDYRALRTRLSFAVRKVCPGWLRPHHDDLVQQGILKVHRRYEGKPVNSSLLYRVAHSVIVDEIRRQRRRNEVHMTPTTPDRVAGPAHATPEAVAQGARVGEAIQGCLAKLSTDRRRAVTLHLLGQSVPEVADQLGFSDKKAENLVYRGMKDLRRHLTDRGLVP